MPSPVVLTTRAAGANIRIDHLTPRSLIWRSIQFVETDEPAVADDVRDEDGGQTALRSYFLHEPRPSQCPKSMGSRRLADAAAKEVCK